MKRAIVVTALLCFAIFCASQTPKSKRIPQQNSGQNTSPTNNAAQHEQTTATPPNQAIAIYTQSGSAEANGEKKHSQDAIDIERQLAKFTGYLVLVGIVQCVILLGQGILFFQQKRIMGEHKVSLEQLAGAAADNAAAANKNAEFSRLNAVAAEQNAVAAKASADVSEKTLVLTQRPRIVVRAFYFSEPTGVGGVYRVPKRIEAGSFCTGQFYIENCGGTDARIREIYSEVYIAENLPMKRPYEGKVGSKEEQTLRPGTSAFHRFGRMEPLDAQTATDVTKHFYVLGYIGYTDDLAIYRTTAFCRRYNATKDRFLPVDDPDYEYAD
jgi:hypothetical protein